MNKKYSVLVNSTDTYEDCWLPFFKLFNKYWKEKDVKVFLNTEEKAFKYSGLNIISTKIGYKKDNKRFSWSESLIIALDKIDTPIVLLILDDLFLDAEVDTKMIDYLARLMIKNNYSTIYFTDQSTNGPFADQGELLWELDQKADYRVSALIALWDKERLKTYLRKHENPWQFEIYGTKRAHYIKDSFYTLNQDIYNINSKKVISHCNPTGITRGKWNKEAVIELFKNNDIKIDFNKRGFYTEEKRTLKQKIMNRLNIKRLILELRSIAEIQYLIIRNMVLNKNKI